MILIHKYWINTFPENLYPLFHLQFLFSFLKIENIAYGLPQDAKVTNRFRNIGIEYRYILRYGYTIVLKYFLVKFLVNI